MHSRAGRQRTQSGGRRLVQERTHGTRLAQKSLHCGACFSIIGEKEVGVEGNEGEEVVDEVKLKVPGHARFG